jgi:DNA-binding SARP family transcriptional activator
VQLFLLGPLEVKDRGVVVVLPSDKQRALLAALLLRRNSVVSAEELIDALWEQPPRTARPSLLNHVARLRHALPSAMIETLGRGYRLRTNARDVDLDRFLSYLARARELQGSRRSEALRHADLLWRGSALADVMLFGSLAAEVEALDELRLEALEDRLEADLEAGRHRELIPELEILAAQHPLRERLLEQLMIALYRSGRQADALATYRLARRRLVDELGLDPGAAVMRLERAILAHDLPISPRTRRDAPPSLLTRTVELAPGTYAEKAEFAYRLGIALSLMGEHEHSCAVLEEALDRAELARARHIVLRVQLRLELDRARREGAPLAEMGEFAAHAAAEFEELGDDLGQALALLSCGVIRRDLGRVEQAVEYFRQAESHSRRAVGTSWPTGLILAVEGEALFLGPLPVADAMERCDEILDSVDWGPPGPLGVYCSLGMLHAMRNEFAAARAHIRRAAAACEEYGLVAVRAGWVMQCAAEIEELAGALDVAEALRREAYTQLGAADASAAAFVAGAHARVLALLGRADEARARATMAAPLNEDDVMVRVGWLRAEALTRAAMGDARGAAAHAQDAVDAVSQTDLLPTHAETMLDLASVLAKTERDDDAVAAASTARNLFERKGHLVGLEHADQFLAERVELT